MGRVSKVKDLEERYPDLLNRQAAANSKDSELSEVTSKSTVHGSSDELDLVSVMKASQAISGEIRMDKLLEKLMGIVIENAGAERGVLLLVSEDELTVEANITLNQDQATILNSTTSDSAPILPLSVINYIKRTAHHVILDDAARDELYCSDPYIQSVRPLSILGSPIKYKSQLYGIIYLENNLISGAFGIRHFEILKLLSSQIAVSIENARLYESLKTSNDELTKSNIDLTKEVTKRKKAEEELRFYQNRLEQLVEQKTVELKESRLALAHLKRGLRKRERFGNIIGKSEKMQELYKLLEDLADVSSTVLITGESGTGKELVAEALHHGSARKEKPFVKVNCAALSETVLESELFGHVQGAFTGAMKNKEGRFQKAGDGTILLDELGDISTHFQKRLLRVLQEREFEQVGATKPIKMKARVLASTNQNLPDKIKQGEFREDLYYRLRVVEINLPPLRDRMEDVPLLTSHFLEFLSSEMNKEIFEVSEEVLRRLMEYSWPGNVRELKHTLECAFILTKSDVITLSDLPKSFTKDNADQRVGLNGADERAIILSALEQAKWNKTQAAKLLAVGRRTLYRKLQQHNISH